MKCSKENFVVEARKYFKVAAGKNIWNKADTESWKYKRSKIATMWDSFDCKNEMICIDTWMKQF